MTYRIEVNDGHGPIEVFDGVVGCALQTLADRLWLAVDYGDGSSSVSRIGENVCRIDITPLEAP